MDVSNLKKTFQVKDPEDLDLLQYLDTRLWAVLSPMFRWCRESNLPCVITSTVRGRLQHSVSDTHAEGRAVDISVKGWAAFQILAFEKTFNDSDIGKRYGATSITDGKVRVVVFEPNNASKGITEHLHIQVSKT
jgi:hypothetical protein